MIFGRKSEIVRKAGRDGPFQSHHVLSSQKGNSSLIAGNKTTSFRASSDGKLESVTFSWTRAEEYRLGERNKFVFGEERFLPFLQVSEASTTGSERIRRPCSCR
jgi:hypothetical protein